MITIITGVPGSGKTLYAMHLMEGESKKGREIYADIDGCGLPGVHAAPDDWRTLPDGSLCVYDEAHQRFPATGKAGLSGDMRVQDLDTHRHHGYDLVFITQASTRLHHDIRKMAGQHIHVQRNFGAQTVTLYRWERAANENDKNDREQSDTSLWHYPKRLFRHYKSATIHTHRRRVPAKLVGLSLIALALFGGAVYSFSDGSFLAAASQHSMAADKVVAVAAAEPDAPVGFAPAVSTGSNLAWASKATIPPVAGCIASDTLCRCYAYDGLVIDMSLAQCRSAMSKPLPISIKGRGGSAAAAAPLPIDPSTALFSGGAS